MVTAFVVSGGGSLGAVRVRAPGSRHRTATERWLDDGGPSRPHPERFLSLHRDTCTLDPCHGGQAA